MTQADPIANRVVIDLETTGPRPDVDSILEVGCRIFDPTLSIHIASLHLLVQYESVQAVELEYERAIDFIKDMHTKNGLWEDLKNAAVAGAARGIQAFPIAKIDEVLAQFISIHAPPVQNPNKPNKPEKPWAVGNNVESLDLPFLREDLKQPAALLHYRSINVSTLRGIASAESGLDFYRREGISQQESDHRVMSDIDSCIACYHWSIAAIRGQINS
jgi:oligoribonuclease (3'-5' exoribonuclease)